MMMEGFRCELGPQLHPRDTSTLPNEVRFIFIISARQKTVCADQHFFFLRGIPTLCTLDTQVETALRFGHQSPEILRDGSSVVSFSG